MEKEVTITVTAPVDCTDEEFKEWVEFCVGYMGGMSMENPLHEYSLEVRDVTIY